MVFLGGLGQYLIFESLLFVNFETDRETWLVRLPHEKKKSNCEVLMMIFKREFMKGLCKF